MTEIIRNYGRTMLAMVVAGALLTLFFCLSFAGEKGLPRTLGKQMKEKMGQETYGMTTSNQAIRRAKEDPVPTATTQTLLVGKSYQAKDMILARDARGEEASFSILWIEDTDSREVVKAQEDAAGEENYCFERSGIYRAKVMLWDAQGSSQNGWIYLRVEEGEQG